MTTRLEALDRAVQKLQHALEDVDDAASAVILEPGGTLGRITHISDLLRGAIEHALHERRQEKRRLELEGK